MIEWIHALLHAFLFLLFLTFGDAPLLVPLIKLTPCRRAVLVYLFTHPDVTASALERVMAHHSVPHSTYWHTLRGMVRKGLVVYDRGHPVQLTSFGNIIAKTIQENDQNETKRNTQ